jgi:hypothetical protein
MKKFETAIETLYSFHCPGCGYDHSVRTSGHEPRWELTGLEEDTPTVSPSILVNANIPGATRCYSFVRSGKVEYLSDCTHSLAGKTVDMLDYETKGDHKKS